MGARSDKEMIMDAKTKERIKKMSYEEFHDWLLFDSPEADKMFKSYESLRYVTATAQESFVLGMRKRLTSK